MFILEQKQREKHAGRVSPNQKRLIAFGAAFLLLKACALLVDAA